MSHPDTFIDYSNPGMYAYYSFYGKPDSIVLEDCPDIDTLPDDLHVGKNLYLFRCIRLESLPEKLHVGGDLILDDCKDVKALPQNLYVGGFICADGTGIGLAASKSLTELKLELFDWRYAQQPTYFNPATFSGERILSIHNATARRDMLRMYGFERFINDVNPAVLDRDHDAGGKRELLRVILLRDEDIVCLKLSCPSTQAVYIIRVPPRMKTCKEAAAWIAGFDDPRKYRPLVET